MVDREICGEVYVRIGEDGLFLQSDDGFVSVRSGGGQ